MTKTVDYKYKCFNDCVQTGCPGHSMQLQYHHTSDTLTVVRLGHKDSHGEWVNNGIEGVYDRNELLALVRAWEEMRKR